MKLNEVDLLKLQTRFMQRDPTTQGFCSGLTPELRKTAEQIRNITIYKTIDSLEDNAVSHALLDELAWQFHVDFYDTRAELSVKRNLVKQSIIIHKHKGTPKAVEDLLRAAFPSDTILLEWFHYNGEPHHFKIITSEKDTDRDSAFVRALNSVKNVRSYLDSIELFTIVYMYANNLITIKEERTYELPNVVSVGEFQPLAFGDGQTLSLGEDQIGFYK